jgi:hypothetical protein
MITTSTLEPTTDTELSTQDTIDTVESVALDEVNGGWLYSPYAYGYASPYASPYAAARYEARLERRAEWVERRAAARYWGF